MSFVDGRVIRQRMAKKDARMAKIAAKRIAKSAKIVGAAECLNTQTAPDRNGQTLTEGAHRVTAIPHSNPTTPIRLKFTSTTPFMATGKNGHKYEISWHRDRGLYALTFDGVELFTGKHKTELVASANQIELNSVESSCDFCKGSGFVKCHDCPECGQTHMRKCPSCTSTANAEGDE